MPTKKTTQMLVPELRFPEFQDESPWQLVPLGSHADIIKERAGKKKYPVMSIETGVGLVSQMEKFGRDISGNSYKNYTVIQKDDFAYNKSATKGFPEGFIAKHNEEGKAAVPNSIFTCFRITSGEIQSEYLYFQLLNNLHGKWLRKFITVGARAHGALSVNAEDLLALPVPLPTGASSKPEQQKIANCLGSLDELLAAHRRKLAALQDHKKGLLQQLFPAEGKTTPNLRFPGFEGEWVVKELGELLSSRPDYGVNSSAVPFSENLPRYLRITDISEDGRYLPDKQVSVDLDATDGNYLDEGDIVLARTGASVGKSYQYRKENGKLVFAGFLIRIKPDPSRLISAYLANFLTSDRFWKWVKATSARSGQPGINSTEYSLLAITLPPDISEQQKIADCLSALDALITARTDQLTALKVHKTGLMQKLFPSEPQS